MFSVRGKLYALNGSAWKERGVGVLKVNVNELTRRARIRRCSIGSLEISTKSSQ